MRTAAPSHARRMRTAAPSHALDAKHVSPEALVSPGAGLARRRRVCLGSRRRVCR